MLVDGFFAPQSLLQQPQPQPRQPPLLWNTDDDDDDDVNSVEGNVVPSTATVTTVTERTSTSGRAKGVVFEFQGCYVHGCPRCFLTNRDTKMTYQRSLNDAYVNTRAKIAVIRNFGYEVREMWECEFDRVKRGNPDIDAYLNDHPIVGKLTLDPRAAFYGGRTENTVIRYVASATERIKYTDICSLYPYVCKRGKFPLGHPRIYIGDECDELTNGRNDDLSRVEGLVKCRVLPPRSLFLPALPVKANKRLLFPLCRSCCEDESVRDRREQQRQQRHDETMDVVTDDDDDEDDHDAQERPNNRQRRRDGGTRCTHETDEERELRGTWVVDELRKAVEVGYRVIELQIIWQYDTTTRFWV